MSKNTKILLGGLVVLVILFGGIGYIFTTLKILFKIGVIILIGIVLLYIVARILKK